MKINGSSEVDIYSLGICVMKKQWNWILRDTRNWPWNKKETVDLRDAIALTVPQVISGILFLRIGFVVRHILDPAYLNRSFPSCLLLQCQNESSCETIPMKMISPASPYQTRFPQRSTSNRFERKIRWGCPARFPKPLPYLWRRSAIFPALFMTWSKIRSPIYDLTLKSKPCFWPAL